MAKLPTPDVKQFVIDHTDGPKLRESDGSYGWLIAIVGAFTLVFTLGTSFSYGIFVGPFSDQYALSEVAVSVIFALHLFAAYTLAGIVGILATRYPPNRVLLGTGGVTGLLAPSLYFVESFPALMLIFTILGTALGSALVVIVSVIPQWFDDSRGLATGFLFVGIGLSLLVMPPAWNIAFTSLGVQDGFLMIVGLTACSFLAAGFVITRPPWLPDTSVPFRALRVWITQLTRTRQFYYLFVGFGFAFAWFFLLAGFGVEFFESRGFDRTMASLAFGLIGGISIFSRLGSGGIADKIGYGRTMSLSLIFASIGCLMLFLPGTVSIYVGIVLFGVSLGGVTTLYIPILLQIYDPDKSTAVVGIFTGGLGVPALLAPPIATTLVSSTGSFVPIIVLTLSTTLAAVVLVWLGQTSNR